jgi:putative ABC transport system permease protein
MTTLRLALRNLMRSPRRTVLTTVAVIAGIAAFILGEGFIGGVEENIIVTSIDGSVGHALVRPADYPVQAGRHPVDELVTLSSSARALLDREAAVWTERLMFAPTVAAGEDSLRAVGIGYDPERDEAVFPRRLWQIDGALPDPDAREVAPSFRLARLLSLAPGDPLVLQVRTHRGAMNALEVTVSGRVNTGNPAQDMFGILVPQKLARELVATELPSHVVIRLRDRDQAQAFAARLAPELGPGLEVSTWIDETAELLELQAFRRKALNLVVFILLALAGLGIANTILMAAHERVREIGTLRALGMTEAGVMRLFVVEGALVGVAGSVLGALAGGGLTAWWSKHPIDLSRALEDVGSSLPVSGWIYTRFDGTMIALTVALGVAVAALASIYPARVASRMPPAEAVRAP